MRVDCNLIRKNTVILFTNIAHLFYTRRNRTYHNEHKAGALIATLNSPSLKVMNNRQNLQIIAKCIQLRDHPNTIRGSNYGTDYSKTPP